MANMRPKKICIQTVILFEILSLIQQEILVEVTSPDIKHSINCKYITEKANKLLLT